MDAIITTEKNRKSAIAGVILIIAIVLLIGKCVNNSQEMKRQNEAIATAQGFAKIIHEKLADKTELVVQKATGTLEATSVNHGTIFDTWQKSKVPYTAQYSVDLSQVDLSHVRYDSATETMFVEIPNIVVSPPNIDETGKVILDRGGYWTSRDASEKLAYRFSKLAVAGATASINQPEKIHRAQNNARIMVDGLLELPLRAAKLSNVHVVVRFPTDGSRDGDRWDISPSIAEVLARARNGTY